MFINWARMEINLKIVYYGPALSGKTTNLEQIHRHIDPGARGEMVSLKTSGDRTLYFDFMQIELKPIARLVPRLHLYTVPGQPQYEISRKLVLRGADGVVFVADSDPRRMLDNQISWQNLKKQLLEYRINLADFPITLQFNKRDLPNAIGVATLKTAMQTNGAHPVVEASALHCVGVQETLGQAVRGVMMRVHRLIEEAGKQAAAQEAGPRLSGAPAKRNRGVEDGV